MNSKIKSKIKSRIINVAAIGLVVSFFEMLQILFLQKFLSIFDNSVRVQSEHNILNSISINENNFFRYLIFVIICTMLIRVCAFKYSTDLSFKSQEDLSKRYIQLFVKIGEFNFPNSMDSIVSDVINRTYTIANYFYLPLSNIIIHSSISLFIFLTLLYSNFQLTLLLIGVISFSYASILVLFHSRLKGLSNQISVTQENKINYVSFFYSAFRELISNKKKTDILNNFYINEEQMRKSISHSQLISFLPRYFLEGLGLVVVCSILTVGKEDKTLEVSSVIITVFGLIRLLPSLQQIYSSFAALKVGKVSYRTFMAKLDAYEKIDAKIDSKSFPFSKIEVISSLHEGEKLIFESNKKYLIKGVSGIGKSTILEAIANISPKLTVLVDGVSLDINERINFSKNISYLSQSFSAIATKNIFQLINFSSLNNHSDVIGEEVFSSENLSGGEKQRLLLINALMYGNKLVLLDEPTSALDSSVKKLVFDMIKNFDGTLICVSHENDFDYAFSKIYKINSKLF